MIKDIKQLTSTGAKAPVVKQDPKVNDAGPTAPEAVDTFASPATQEPWWLPNYLESTPKIPANAAVTVFKDAHPDVQRFGEVRPQVVQSGDTVRLKRGQSLQVETWTRPSARLDWDLSTTVESNPTKTSFHFSSKPPGPRGPPRGGGEQFNRYVWDADAIGRMGGAFDVILASRDVLMGNAVRTLHIVVDGEDR